MPEITARKGVHSFETPRNNDGAPLGCDPDRIDGARIFVKRDPDDQDGEEFSFVLTTTNDPLVSQVFADFHEQITNMKLSLEERRELTHQVYREVARRKKAEAAAAKAPAPPVATPPTPPSPELTMTPEMDATVERMTLELERTTMPEPAPRPPEEFDENREVEFYLAGGGSVIVNCMHATIQGDNVILVFRRGVPFYRPPKSDGGEIHEVRLRVGGLKDIITTFMVHDPYVVGDRQHLILMMDRG